jgi:hypothetical protein
MLAKILELSPAWRKCEQNVTVSIAIKLVIISKMIECKKKFEVILGDGCQALLQVNVCSNLNPQLQNLKSSFCQNNLKANLNSGGVGGTLRTCLKARMW